MPFQTIIDTTGDSRHIFNPHDLQELAKAEQRFKDLTGHSFTAAVRTGPGEVSRIKIVRPQGGGSPLLSAPRRGARFRS
jgi:hypothetical protein